MRSQKLSIVLICGACVASLPAPASIEEPTLAYLATPTGLFLVDPDTQRIERSIFTGGERRNHGRVAVHPTRPIAYLNEVASISVVDLASETVAATIDLDPGETEFVDRLVIASDGSRAYTIRGRTLWVIDALEDRVVTSIDAGAVPVDLEIHPDGLTLYILSGRGWVRVVDATALEITTTIKLPDNATDLAMNALGSQLMVTVPARESVVLVDTTRLEVAATIEVGPSPTGVVFAPDGGRGYVLTSILRRGPRPDFELQIESTIAVIDTTATEIVDQISVPFRAAELTPSPNGAELYLLRAETGRTSLCYIPIVDLEEGAISAAIDIPERTVRLRGQPDLQLGSGPRVAVRHGGGDDSFP